MVIMSETVNNKLMSEGLTEDEDDNVDVLNDDDEDDEKSKTNAR